MDSVETNETTAIEQTSETIVENVVEPTEQTTEQPEVAENTETPAPDTDASPVEETPETPVDETAEAAEEPAEESNLPQTMEEVVARAKELAQSEEPAEKAELDLLKVLFYKIHNADVQQAQQAFVEAGGEAEKFMPELNPLEPEFRAYMQILREKRAAAQEELEKQKEANLQRKLAILERLQQLASTPEEANKAFDEFKALQSEWKEIKNVPAERATELWKNYQLYVEQFYDLLKLGHELRDYDFKKNLEAKTRLCEQAEALGQAEDVVSANNQLQTLHQEWKETGPVAKELREELWNRFKEASTVVRKRHQEHFEAIKATEEENLSKKTALCEEIEQIQTDGLKTFAEWEGITEKIKELQAKWKTIGYAPQKVNTQIFERFRKACDTFFEKKADYFRTVKDTLNENLARKKALVEKAEELMNSTEWRKTSDALVKLQQEWKQIGTVPRRYSEGLWKRFIGACDHFFEEKQKATAGERSEQAANLEQKKSIIEQLKALAEGGVEDVVQKLKDLQKQWNEVGHVPFRDKDKVYNEYRQICDKLYKDLNLSQARRRLDSFKTNLASKIEKEGSSLSRERERMMRAFENMKTELQTYENNLGFLTANSKKGNSLVDTMKKKMEKLRDELNLLSQKIKAVDEQISNEE